MGKAKIQSHLGAGLYFATYYRDIEFAQKEIDRLEKLRRELESEIYKPGGLNDQLIDLDFVIQEKSVIFNDALEAWKTCAETIPPCPESKSLMATVLVTSKDKSKAINDYMKVQAKISSNKAEMLEASRRIAFFQNYGTTKGQEGMNLWCVDYPHEDTGPIPGGTVVGTIETYGGRNVAGKDFYGPAPMINIQVSYGGSAPYSAERDYQIQPLGAESVATSLYNSIEWLGVMAKRPLHEMGTLTDKNEATNTGTVQLYGTTLSTTAPAVAGLFPKTLANIPIVYQTCHAKVFEVGDEVIVKYGGHLRENPTVIGFASNPRECKWFNFTYTCQTGLYLVGETSQLVLKGLDGSPVWVMPSSDTYTFIGWDDHKLDNPRTDLNAQSNISVVAKSMLTPTWPDSLSLHVGKGLVLGAGVCCFGGTSSVSGDDYTRTFNGQDDQLPEALEAVAQYQDWYVDTIDSWSGGNAGLGLFVFPVGDLINEGRVGLKVIDGLEDTSYEYVAGESLTCTNSYVASADDAALVNCSVAFGTTQTGSYATGSCSSEGLGTWKTTLASHMNHSPMSVRLGWEGTHEGEAVYLERWYDYSHVDSINGKFVFAKGGQVVPL